MFILSVVPKDILDRCLIGGEETVSLMQYLGLLFPCDIDPSIMVPYVQLFPLDVHLVNCDLDDDCDISRHSNSNSQTTPIVLVTDFHPTVLSQTVLGRKEEDGAVMYIGPDSLALVQHLPLQEYALSLQKDSHENIKIIDFCAGSGIQAISTLISLQGCCTNATALFVDINQRALRFARFNAILNGIQEDRISTINADITAGNDFIQCIGGEPFDIILANPPFIPVPEERVSKDSEISSSCIEKRYGLFSSGGPSGEDVLESIISLSPRLFRSKKGGLLAIVSEFMNPPEGKEENQSLMQKIKKWWQVSITSSEQDDDEDIIPRYGKGILFTNEHPVTAAIYSSRRADNQLEFEKWSNHLKSCHINSVSPGLLFVKLCERTSNEDGNLILTSCQVPRTKLGSIWTPFNIHAVQYTKRKWGEIMK